MYVRILRVIDDYSRQQTVRLVSTFTVNTAIAEDGKETTESINISFVEPLNVEILIADLISPILINAMMNGADQIWIMLGRNIVWVSDKGLGYNNEKLNKLADDLYDQFKKVGGKLYG